MVTDKYYVIKFDKNHIRLIVVYLSSVDNYPYDKNFLYFVFKQNPRGDMIPVCVVEKGIVNMTFMCAYNFGHYING